MNIDLPKVEHFEDFYIWFNKDEKLEYYSTPLYKVDFSFDFADNEDKSKKKWT